MTDKLVKVLMSESSARATLKAVEEDPDRSKWGHHQWIRNDAIIELREALDGVPTHQVQHNTKGSE